MSYNYYEHLAKTEQIRDRLAHSVVNDIIGHIQVLQEYSVLSLPGIYILDYVKREYLFFSKNIKELTGYYSEDFIDGGLPFFLDKMHEDDLSIFTQKLFAKNISFLQTVPYAQHPQYVFSTTFHYKVKKGGYLNFQQKNIFLQSTPEGVPLYSMGVGYVIPNIMSDRVNYTIENQIGLFSPKQGKVLFSQQYFVKEEDTILSSREREVLKWMSEGLSSKQIADKLHISTLTVKKHRSNIMSKTDSKNSNEAVSYAIKHHLI